MNVLSLFDGISCAYVALERAGIPVKTYYSCEIEKNAIKISETHYPTIVRLGSVVELKPPSGIDILIGGSPCQDLSIAKKDRKGLDGERSGLFWEYVRIKKECNPRWFVLENVASMPRADRDVITREMGVEPVMFNASLVSAQCRKRLFWTNIPFELPADRGILLKHILQENVDDKFIIKKKLSKTAQTGRNETKKLGYVGENDHQAKRVYDEEGKLPALNVVCNSMVKVGYIGKTNSQTNRVYSPDGKAPTQCKGPNGGATPTLIKVGYIGEGEQNGQGGQAHRVYDTEGKTPTLSSFAPLIKLGHIGNTDSQANRVYSTEGKSSCLSANGGGLGAKTGLYTTDSVIRKLTPIECERLQGLPDGYTEGIAISNRYKVLGNAFNVDVIAHIFTQMKPLCLLSQ